MDWAGDEQVRLGLRLSGWMGWGVGGAVGAVWCKDLWWGREGDGG